MAGNNPNFFKHAQIYHQQQRKRKPETPQQHHNTQSQNPHNAHGNKKRSSLGGVVTGHDQHKPQQQHNQQSYEELKRETRMLPIFFGKQALIEVGIL